MRIGYARVSTLDQNVDMQLKALDASGCERVFTDLGHSGALRQRPGLAEAMAVLRSGDTLVIWRLDRLGRSLSHLIELVNDLGRRGIALYSVTEAIDTGSAGGLLIFHIMGALAEFERGLISERTRAGMAAARLRGQAIGRPAKLGPEGLSAALDLMVHGGVSLADAARRQGISRATLCRALRRRRALISVDAVSPISAPAWSSGP
ncbi:recombinase family protein [Rhizobium wuzhouense]|uniref:DNA resolvase n=1 Tax=Rhizobium wuzhouense TaxID=1986026 RepID=A0ABX5NW35_9HYPH|nr:recombinase family protein [Rhizobium wuzhouense]PYB73273.1 DNA resolvase [Rhizobium wuzhouense]